MVACDLGVEVLASDSYAALIALRAKRGEFEALSRVTAEQPGRVQPLIDFDADSASPATQLQRIECVARVFSGFGRPIMVDASEINPTMSYGSQGPLGELTDRLSGPADVLDGDYPVSIIPVLRHGAPDELAAYTARLSEEIGAGMALRIRAGTANRSHIARAIERLTVDLRHLDVIVDLQYIDSVRPAQTEHVRAILDAISDTGPVRSVALLSGSVPSMLGGTALWQQPRYEELLWREVATSGAEYVRFGDYGVAHPLASKAFRSKHVSIKYACSSGWIYGRERLTGNEDVADDDVVESSRAYTFRLVCRRLVVDKNFAGRNFSWGDLQLADAAGGGGSGLGATSKPVAFATSHHLAYLAMLGSAA